MNRTRTSYAYRPLIAAITLSVVTLGFTVNAVSSYASSRPAVKPNGSIVIAESNPMQSIDPIYDAGSLDQLFSIYTGLTIISNTGAVVPGLATSWTSNSTATQWVFTLRSGAKFQNGDPVKISDVIFTFDQMEKPASAQAIYLSDLVSMKQDGPNKITFVLKTPYAAWPRQLTLLPIVPQKYYQQVGATKFALHPIGSGPYQVVSYSIGSTLVLKAFPGFWGGAPKIENVTYEEVASDTARTDGVESSALSVALIAPDQVSTVSGLSSYTLDSIPSNQAYYVGFNLKAAPLDNLDFRKAVDYAIDRASITKNVFYGLARPDGQIVAPATFGYDPSVKATAYNLAMAKSYLAKSGYSGQSIQLAYPTTSYPLMPEAAQVIGAELQAAGINVKLEGSEANSFILNWTGKTFPGLFIFAFHPSTLDAGIELDYLYGPHGFAYFSNPAVDSLITKQYAEPIVTQRLATIAKIWEMTKSEELYAPLYVDDYSYAISKKLIWTPRPDGLILPDGISFK